MEIGEVFKLREGIEIFPGERLRVFHQPAHFEAPILQRDFRFDAEIENREALGKMLARRKTLSRARSEPDRRISEPDGRFSETVRRFFFGSLRPCFRRGAYSAERGASAPEGHFASPAFFALDQARVGCRH